MRKTLRQLIRAARDFAQPINHGSEPEALRIALAKRALQRQLHAEGYSRKHAIAEASARFANAGAHRAGELLIATEDKHGHQ